MTINTYNWESMEPALKSKILARSEDDIRSVEAQIAPIVEAVRGRGDQAIIEFEQKFDCPHYSKEMLWVTEKEIQSAYDAIDSKVLKALEYAIENITTFHKQTMDDGKARKVQVRPGIAAYERLTAIDSTALYVPYGRGSFPSMFYMLAIPALLAKVPYLVVTTPPNKDGSVDQACLAAAKILGIKNILRAGGAQAISALAYGTETVKPVLKIIGPGSRFVAAAKRTVSHKVDIGLPAGPSESLVLADEKADPRLVALDLLIEAEHGADSSALLVTPSSKLAQEVSSHLKNFIEKIPGLRKQFVEAVFSNYGGIILGKDMATCVEIVNEFAPEHLQIQAENPWELTEKITNASEILLGRHTPFSAANYLTGPNAVLPTGGRAKTFGPVSVRDFQKASSIVEATQAGYEEFAAHVLALADYEGFFTHAEAIRAR